MTELNHIVLWSCTGLGRIHCLNEYLIAACLGPMHQDLRGGMHVDLFSGVLRWSNRNCRAPLQSFTGTARSINELLNWTTD